MNAVDYINENKNVLQLLKHKGFEDVRVGGDYARACCKIHNGDNKSSFVINLSTGLWYCHTGGCGGGDIFTLVQKMNDIDFKSSVRWLSNFFNLDIENMQIKERQASYMEELNKFISVMRSKRNQQVLTPYTVDGLLQPVTKYRDFKQETLEHFGVTYTEEIKLLRDDGSPYSLRERLIFPIMLHGEQIGVSLRATNQGQVPKWSHQPKNIKTSLTLLNLDSIKDSAPFVVVEGILDVMAYYEIGVNAVATFGSHLSNEQYKLLLKTGSDIGLSYDGDNAGREATKNALNMLRNKANVSIITLPESTDPESLTREELRNAYARRSKIL